MQYYSEKRFKEIETERKKESVCACACVCGCTCVCVWKRERERADKKDQLFVHCLQLFNIIRVATVGGQDCFSFLLIKFEDWRQSGVNFTNILKAAFVSIFLHQKITKSNLSMEKLQKYFRTKNLLIKCWWNWLKVDCG